MNDDEFVLSETMYKAVCVSSDGRLSSFAVTGRGDTTYVPGEWTEAKPEFAAEGYHLLVFESVETALQFITAPSLSVQLWKCECVDEVPLPTRRSSGCLAYKLPSECKEAFEHWPEGTRMFKRVMLTEKIA